ncbi:hypothetical protein M409DRAFT_27082 [Zasmidium cellare ATCC 36951]|uniref:Uncharacterized protein n=1 Tax=Zasmidium cellare ATCC 36951 TaxID=1080233 RepID=A0A6A6C879_ZASCE|nr:uncharacterized protein M409DRAFT_27082 [Zasmidium cellare ATCC 36951]KAF2162458.1 hypothetical protein M409DRAFT_27082 [Zasmidium cellare ATCC 36951]
MAILSQALLTLSATLPTLCSSAKPLEPFVYNNIPLGSIAPNGWLQGEMETEANSLSGHLYDFWKFVHDSSWLGGNSEYSGLNEAFPYWLNGLVPLAYGVDDVRLKGQVFQAMDYLLEHMVQEDGWIGPEKDGPGGGARLIWARTLLFEAWTNIADVAGSNYTKPVVAAMHNFNKLMVSMLENNGTGLIPQVDSILDDGYYFWGRGRVQDLILSLEWLYDNYPEGNEMQLLQGIELLHYYGWNWEDWFDESAYAFGNLNSYSDDFSNDNYQYLHGVNVGEGLKAAAVIRRYTYNESLVQTGKDGNDWTFQYHGNPMGSVIADEREDGLNPWSGSETCTAVEVIFSQAYNYRAFGDTFYADSAELSAFNALPGALTEDWWAHNYMSQPNSPFSKNLTSTPFYDVNTVGQTYGLEPDYPCCTVNHPAGLPKFLQNTFMTVGNNGLLHALLSPATVKTTVSGGNVQVECETNYPFESTLFYNIEAEKRFEFYARIPGWATSAVLRSSTGMQAGASENDVVKIAVPQGKSRLLYTLGTSIRTTPRANDTVAVYYGQLLYAIEISADVTSTPPHNYYTGEEYPPGYAPPQSRDYVMINNSEWNIAIDPSTLRYVSSGPSSYAINDSPQALPTPIFAAGAPPMHMTAQGCLIDWPLIYNGSTPGPPPTGNDRKCLGTAFQVKLVPYASAKLHMAELPVLNLRNIH